MKKEEICVLIDTPEKAKKAYKMLSDAGEECEIIKDMVNGNCTSSEIADLIAPCIRRLSE